MASEKNAPISDDWRKCLDMLDKVLFRFESFDLTVDNCQIEKICRRSPGFDQEQLCQQSSETIKAILPGFRESRADFNSKYAAGEPYEQKIEKLNSKFMDVITEKANLILRYNRLYHEHFPHSSNKSKKKKKKARTSEIIRIQQETEEQIDKERNEHEKELEFQHSRFAALQAEHDSRKEQIDKLDSTLLQKDLETEKIKTDLIKLKQRHKQQLESELKLKREKKALIHEVTNSRKDLNNLIAGHDMQITGIVEGNKKDVEEIKRIYNQRLEDITEKHESLEKSIEQLRDKVVFFMESCDHATVAHLEELTLDISRENRAEMSNKTLNQMLSILPSVLIKEEYRMILPLFKIVYKICESRAQLMLRINQVESSLYSGLRFLNEKQVRSEKKKKKGRSKRTKESTISTFSGMHQTKGVFTP